MVSAVTFSVFDFFTIAEEVMHNSEKSISFEISSKSLFKLIIKFASKLEPISLLALFTSIAMFASCLILKSSFHFLFKLLWRVSDLFRKFLSSLPSSVKRLITPIIAYLIYFPIARFTLLCHRLGINVENFPLTDYKDKPFYFMKTDALDRFGTRLEKRFSKKEIIDMLTESGFKDINFSDGNPCWVCISRKA